MSLSLCFNFSDLRDLHKCANNLLHSPQFKQTLIHQHDDNLVSLIQEVSETSLKMLDLFSATRDVFHLVKEYFQELQQLFRKSKIEGSSFQSHIPNHCLSQKRLKKEVVKSLTVIKAMKSTCFTSDLSFIDHSLIVVVHVIREVRSATISILESLLSLITLPTTITIVQNPKPFALRLMRMTCQRILLERCDSIEICMANKKLKEIVGVVKRLEVELESIIRRLMQTRVLLLNVLTN